MKWKMYALSIEYKFRKFIEKGNRFDIEADSLFSAVECDIEISEIREIGDSTQFFMDFERYNRADKYVPRKADPYMGIGYVKSAGVYYPISGKSAFDVGLEYYSPFFQKVEQTFIEYLKSYKGNINPWLLQEAKKREIL